jgi:hypothetical protein
MRDPEIELPDREVPEADAAEQAAALEEEPESPTFLPDDADEGDAVEQILEVGLDEDEYR